MITTFKRIELQSRAKSQIGGNFVALPNLIWFLKIGLDLTKIWPPEVESIFFPRSYEVTECLTLPMGKQKQKNKDLTDQQAPLIADLKWPPEEEEFVITLCRKSIRSAF